MEDFLIAGIVVAIAEIAKRILKQRIDADTVTQLMPLVVLLLAGGANVVNAAVFDGMPLVTALAEGIRLGAMAGGIYSMGKAALGLS